MEGVVAARRLRKSMLNSTYDSNINFGNIGISNVRKKEKIQAEEWTYFRKLKIKFLIKSLITIILLITCVISNLLFKEKVKNNFITSKIISEYNKDISKEEFWEKFEDITYDIYSGINYIFPKKLVAFVQSRYVEKIKPKLIDFSFYNLMHSSNNNEVVIYTEDEQVKIYDVEEQEEKVEEVPEGVGGGVIEEENVSSSISSSDELIDKIKALNITVNWPVNGTITSPYGVRDKIFEEIGEFHNGLDIANSLGTNIKSATSGKVVKAEYNNKYYGNTIEVEEKGVIFKYAHLNEILVKEGDNVSSGDLIGKMGSTGYSTGSHLHFEVRYENTTVDPQKLLS